MRSRLEKIEEALAHLGAARKLLKEVKAPKALQATFHAMKSTEGARRHELRLEADKRMSGSGAIWHPSADCPCNSCRGTGASNPDAIIVGGLP